MKLVIYACLIVLSMYGLGICIDKKKYGPAAMWFCNVLIIPALLIASTR